MNTQLITNAQLHRVLGEFLRTRHQSEVFCECLEIEDYGLQAIPDTSPAKWHLAHTSWFFETFVLKQYEEGFCHFAKEFEVLFNSYYNGIGEQFPRPKRWLLSRPTVKQVYEYRENITARIDLLLRTLVSTSHDVVIDILRLVRLGVNHEQQHQELLFTDLKYNLYQNPLFPAYDQNSIDEPSIEVFTDDQKSCESEKQHWVEFSGGLVSIGVDESAVNDQLEAFSFDNEGPAHQVWINPFAVSNRLVTNGEYVDFIESGGYRKAEYWLSDAWATVSQENWEAPLYWRKNASDWEQFTLAGIKPLVMTEPVSHVSAYEADAYARWKKARLLTEFEWEYVAKQQQVEGNFVESGKLKADSGRGAGITQLFGDLWEWTSSAYGAYPGYECSEGAVGEYNGKFMCNQLVLRGGSCVTSESHIRSTYRNFFYPSARWQFSGIRLAKNGA